MRGKSREPDEVFVSHRVEPDGTDRKKCRYGDHSREAAFTAFGLITLQRAVLTTQGRAGGCVGNYDLLCSRL